MKIRILRAPFNFVFSIIDVLLISVTGITEIQDLYFIPAEGYSVIVVKITVGYRVKS